MQDTWSKIHGARPEISDIHAARSIEYAMVGKAVHVCSSRCTWAILSSSAMAPKRIVDAAAAERRPKKRARVAAPAAATEAPEPAAVAAPAPASAPEVVAPEAVPGPAAPAAVAAPAPAAAAAVVAPAAVPGPAAPAAVPAPAPAAAAAVVAPAAVPGPAAVPVAVLPASPAAPVVVDLEATAVPEPVSPGPHPKAKAKSKAKAKASPMPVGTDAAPTTPASPTPTLTLTTEAPASGDSRAVAERFARALAKEDKELQDEYRSMPVALKLGFRHAWGLTGNFAHSHTVKSRTSTEDRTSKQSVLDYPRAEIIRKMGKIDGAKHIAWCDANNCFRLTPADVRFYPISQASSSTTHTDVKSKITSGALLPALPPHNEMPEHRGTVTAWGKQKETPMLAIKQEETPMLAIMPPPPDSLEQPVPPVAVAPPAPVAPLPVPPGGSDPKAAEADEAENDDEMEESEDEEVAEDDPPLDDQDSISPKTCLWGISAGPEAPMPERPLLDRPNLNQQLCFGSCSTAESRKNA